MKTKYLLPHRLRRLGWGLFITGLVGGTLYIVLEPLNFFRLQVYALAHRYTENGIGTFIPDNILDEIAGFLMIMGGVFIAFSKEKAEDSLVAKKRAESLIWAVYVNYGILILSLLFLYERSFSRFLTYNMFTLLVVFVIRFRWVLHQSRKKTLPG